ncbi:peroxidase [Musa troglodytarum]|uniref:Peroxidase 1 n=1 Tax=Musa troglodytarum TaxID=320322 RepID=A0A9E7JSN6_9LILI|nr:peroxidase [Musa troglodytarum]
MRSSMALSKSLLLLLLGFLCSSSTEAHVEFGFYNDTCPHAEAIVLDEMTRIIADDPKLAGSLLRMQFQDCFVRGCDASILLDSLNNNVAEKDDIPNKSLRGFGVIDRVKAKLEEACPGIVSCADIIAMAARDSVYLANGPYFPIQTGRRDGNKSEASDLMANLPPPTANITQLKAFFLQKNLTVKDLVVLSGAHTIGFSHCSSFSQRLYNFSGKGDTDPSLDMEYAEKLKRKCKPYDHDDMRTLVKMDPKSPRRFDLGYYKLVSEEKGLFTSDEALLHDPETRAYVERQAMASSAEEFFKDFGSSMVSMGKIGVLTHQKGEIRKKCAYLEGTGSKMRNTSVRCILMCVVLSSLSCVKSDLELDFYDKSCPTAEKMIFDYVKQHVPNAPSLAAALLRMHFHDCFVRGCDGSVLINSTRKHQAEKSALPNQSLRGFDFLDTVKSLVEAECPGVVSCADIIALVARDSVVAIGGPYWNVPTGRRDGLISRSSEASKELPAPTFDFTALRSSFSSKGLNLKDLVVLSGAHTVGVSHCQSFSNRLYNFTGKGDEDPSLDSFYAASLRKNKCKTPKDTTTIVEMDPGSFRTFDLGYYKHLLQRRGLFRSDAALATDAATKSAIIQLVNSPLEVFFKEFGLSMEKMGSIEVKTGSTGEIRKNCAVVNV